MRDIKFRCWYDNQMHKVQDISFRHKNINLFGADIIKFEDGILMQYTGLKDKNGVEIYEGDKVKIIRYDYENGSENSWGDLIPEEVETIITMSFEFVYTFNIMGEFDEESMEVVGNIYEDLKESGE